MTGILQRLRHLRLRLKLAKDLTNAAEVWRAYSAGVPPPALRMKNGGTLVHRPQDTPVPLFLEIVSNGCYRRRFDIHEGVIVDLGANIGLFALDCAYRYPHARVHAYEPDPETFETLRRNIEANGLADRVCAYNEAVGGRWGGAVLSHAHSSIVTRASSASAEAMSGTVPMVDLATVVGRAGRIAALKIDVEGAEVDVFEGADDETLAAIDQIVGEHHERLVPGTLTRLERRFAAARFSFRVCRDPRCPALFTARRISGR